MQQPDCRWKSDSSYCLAKQETPEFIRGECHCVAGFKGNQRLVHLHFNDREEYLRMAGLPSEMPEGKDPFGRPSSHLYYPASRNGNKEDPTRTRF